MTISNHICPTMRSEHIKDYIPQREPVIMVDGFVEVDKSEAVTCLTVRKDSFFTDDDGLMAEAGLIEHIAQSALALAGLDALMNGATEPPLGYIGEIKNFRCHRRPRVGETLHTTVTFGAEVAGVTLITGETRAGSEVVAATKMKIFIGR